MAYLIRDSARDDGSISDYLHFHLESLGAPSHMLSNPHHLYSAFVAFCCRNCSSVSQNILTAIEGHRHAKGDHTMDHKRLVVNLGLNWKSERQKIARDEHLASFGAPATCKRLKIPYPPMGMWYITFCEGIN